jgi:hypothetical protein
MKRRHIFCFLIVLWSNLCFAQLSPNELRFNLYNYNFFVNNEYKGERVSGYTLPGFRLTPTISYTLNEKISIEGGVSLLHFWGASKYPNIVYSNLPNWAGSQHQSGVHLVPFFRTTWFINQNIKFSFGNIDYRDCHLLIEPLYNIENTFSGDPEMGLQIKANYNWFKADLWLDWQTFIFENDKHNETFCLGLTTETKIINKEKFELSLPLNAIVQHLGGEKLQIKSKVHSWVNACLGLKSNVKLSEKFNLYFGADYLKYKQLTGNIMPFKDGFAQFYYLGAKMKKVNFKIAFFDSEDFISILGSQHFCNFSTNTPGLVFDRANQFYAKIDYDYNIGKNCNAKFYCQLWRQNKITGDVLLPDYSADNPEFSEKVIRDGFFSFSVGVVLNLEPSFLIKKFN